MGLPILLNGGVHGVLNHFVLSDGWPAPYPLQPRSREALEQQRIQVGGGEPGVRQGRERRGRRRRRGPGGQERWPVKDEGLKRRVRIRRAVHCGGVRRRSVGNKGSAGVAMFIIARPCQGPIVVQQPTGLDRDLQSSATCISLESLTHSYHPI